MVFPSFPALLRRLAFCHIFMAFSLVFLGMPRVWAGDGVAVVLSDRGGVYGEFFDALNAALAQSGVRRSVKLAGVAGQHLDGAELGNAALVLAVGVKAGQAVNHMELGVPVLHVLVPRQAYEHLEMGRRHGGQSAIYLDQPLGRQLGLMRLIMPGKHKVAVLVGPDSAAQQGHLRSAAAHLGLEVQTEQISNGADIVPVLNRLLPLSDMLWALPDSMVYTRETARPILLTTYRFRRPVFGFSQAYVAAGALAAVYSSPQHIARQVGDWLRAMPAGRVQLPAPQYPAYFNVAVNRSVARSLGLEVGDEHSLAEALAKGGDGE